jgi:hypothetical protein
MGVAFKVTLQDAPGTLARFGMVLGEARVNIEAIQGTSREGKGFIALALDAAGIAYRKREVLVVRVPDEPGMLGDVVLAMSKAGIGRRDLPPHVGHLISPLSCSRMDKLRVTSSPHLSQWYS